MSSGCSGGTTMVTKAADEALGELSCYLGCKRWLSIFGRATLLPVLLLLRVNGFHVQTSYSLNLCNSHIIIHNWFYLFLVGSSMYVYLSTENREDAEFRLMNFHLPLYHWMDHFLLAHTQKRKAISEQWIDRGRAIVIAMLCAYPKTTIWVFQ